LREGGERRELNRTIVFLEQAHSLSGWFVWFSPSLFSTHFLGYRTEVLSALGVVTLSAIKWTKEDLVGLFVSPTSPTALPFLFP